MSHQVVAYVPREDRIEQRILAHLMLFPDHIEPVRKILSPTFFANAENSASYRILLQAADSGAFMETDWIDAVSTIGAISGDLEQAGGRDAIRSLADGHEKIIELDALLDLARSLIPFSDFAHLSDHDLVEAPMQVLPTWVRSFAEATTAALETPPDLALAAALGALAAVAGGRVTVEGTNGHTEPCALWLWNVADPASRKSAIHAQHFAPIVRLEQAHNAANSVAIQRDRSRLRALTQRQKLAENAIATASTEEARSAAENDLEIAITDLAEARAAATLPMQLIADDATPEALAELLPSCGESITLASGEGAGVIEHALGRYSGEPNLDLLLAGHAGEPIRVNRKGKSPIEIASARISICCALQPQVLQDLRHAKLLAGRGFLGRSCFIYPPSTVGKRSLDGPPVPREVATVYEQGLKVLLGFPQTTFYLDDAVQARHLEFARGLESELADGGQFAEVADWAGKAAGLALRFAGLLHAAEHAIEGAAAPAEIPLETIEAAHELVRWAGSHTLRSRAEIGVDAEAGAALKVWRQIVRLADGLEIDRRPIQVNAKNGVIKTAEDLDRALLYLERRGYVYELPKEGKRRRFAINPEALRRHPNP